MSLQLELEAAARFPVVTEIGRDFKAWASGFSGARSTETKTC